MARALVRAVTTPDELVERVEFLRLDASRKLNSSQQAELGQFFTPAFVARLMASLSRAESPDLSCLTPELG